MDADLVDLAGDGDDFLVAVLIGDFLGLGLGEAFLATWPVLGVCRKRLLPDGAGTGVFFFGETLAGDVLVGDSEALGVSFLLAGFFVTFLGDSSVDDFLDLFSGGDFKGDDARLFFGLAISFFGDAFVTLFIDATFFDLTIVFSLSFLLFFPNNSFMPFPLVVVLEGELFWLSSESVEGLAETAPLLFFGGEESGEDTDDALLVGDFWGLGLDVSSLDFDFVVTYLLINVCLVFGLGLFTAVSGDVNPFSGDDVCFLGKEDFFCGDCAFPLRDLLVLFISFTSFCVRTFFDFASFFSSAFSTFADFFSFFSRGLWFSSPLSVFFFPAAPFPVFFFSNDLSSFSFCCVSFASACENSC